CSDIGVSLHSSSSGVDLPMKIIDMFGCGLPVLARDYKCINELVEVGVNGELFKASSDLYGCLLKLFATTTEAQEYQEKLRLGVQAFQNETWEQNWDKNVLSLFSSE
ncbi:hypothetical protein BB560_007217, partial [Smittium megazygosporum]